MNPRGRDEWAPSYCERLKPPLRLARNRVREARHPLHHPAPRQIAILFRLGALARGSRHGCNSWPLRPSSSLRNRAPLQDYGGLFTLYYLPLW